MDFNNMDFKSYDKMLNNMLKNPKAIAILKQEKADLKLEKEAIKREKAEARKLKAATKKSEAAAAKKSKASSPLISE
jgi:peptidoglycan hydrolase CwlO-like protein